MFGTINHRQKQDEQPTDKNVQAENLLEQKQPQIQPMGNEAANANLFTQMIRMANLETGNEFLAGLEDEEEAGDLSEAGENINNENNISNIAEKEDDKENRIAPDESLKDGIGKIAEKIVDAAPKENGGENKDQKAPPKNEEQKEDAEDRPKAEALQNAVQDIFPDMMEQIEAFYKDPEPDQQEAEADALPAIHELNTSMIVHAPKKHLKKKKKSDLEQAAAPMERIKGLNVAVQKLPARKKTGWWSRLWTGTAWYAGKSIGKAINWLANLFILPWFSRKKKKRAFSRSTENPLLTQEKKTHDVIPGWGEKRYQKEPGREDNIIADFRWVPTVWSFLTAGKSEDENGKPLPPKISVNVNQPEAGKDKDISMSGSGHTGIGIEYSRYSLVSNRYERYDKRKRIDDLACDFDKSHRYMLEKNSYSQQDADYAFSLANKQQNADVHGNINIHLAGEIYQSLIFEKIFGGIKQRFKNHITSVADAKDKDVVRNWLDNDLHECISRKKEEWKQKPPQNNS